MLLTFSLFIAFLSTTVTSQIFNLTVDPTTCVAPKEYTAIYAAIVTDETSCMQIANGVLEAQEGCGCAAFAKQISNFASTCWNRIYGCEYQALVANYFDLCSIATEPVPYWPAPDNAPGSCSCNTGQIIETYLASQTQAVRCLQNATAHLSDLSLSAQMDTACSCCATGITISGIYDICPTTDPKLIGLNAILAAVAPFEPWTSCGPSFQEFDCVVDLGYQAPLGTGSVYNPTNTPASGTQTLSNIPGEVTSPASGAVFTWSAVGSEWTVSALSIGDKQALTTEQGAAGTKTAVQGGSGSTQSVSEATSTASSGNSGDSGNSENSGNSGSSGSSGGNAAPSAKGWGNRLEMSHCSLLGVFVFYAVVYTM